MCYTLPLPSLSFVYLGLCELELEHSEFPVDLGDSSLSWTGSWNIQVFQLNVIQVFHLSILDFGSWNIQGFQLNFGVICGKFPAAKHSVLLALIRYTWSILLCLWHTWHTRYGLRAQCRVYIHDTVRLQSSHHQHIITSNTWALSFHLQFCTAPSK